MTIKSFERPLIELSHNLVFKKAKMVNKQYKLSIDDLTAAEKLDFINQFIVMNTNLNHYIQEYLNDACQDRMYAESQPFGDWDE
jgi:hypothetical protein